MIILPENPTQVVLQASITQLAWKPNTQIATVSVRVYSVVSGSEVNALGSTGCSQAPTSGVWRYVWAPTQLLANQYFIEFTITDNGGNITYWQDDLCVWFDSTVTAMTISTVTNQQTLFDKGGNAKRVFNLFDSNGNPTSSNIYSRE
jgi:hypothetical protein